MLFKFIQRETPTSPYPLIIMTILGGLVNGILLSAFSAVASPDKDGIDHSTILLIVCAMALYYYTKKYTLVSSSRLIEQMINRLRKRIVDQVKTADLAAFEGLEQARIYTALTQEVNMLSQSVNAIIYAFQSGIIVLFCLVYIGVISPMALFIMLLAFVLGTQNFIKTQQKTNKLIKSTLTQETAFFKALGHILNGFKELKLHKEKNRAVFHSFAQSTRRLKILNLKIGQLFSFNFIATQTYFYALIGVVAFLLPAISDVDTQKSTSLIIACLFMITPLMMFVTSLPELAKADVAVKNLYAMEQDLNSLTKTPSAKQSRGQSNPLTDFKRLALNKVTFTFPDRGDGEIPYKIGPLSFEINRGDILFIVGGNGSGKTTLLKVLTGLYPKQGGSITLDQRYITAQNLDHYRDLFTGIFADYHLFDKLYGVDPVDPDKVHHLIDKMQIADKTDFINERFTNTQLSLGQRKRLGMIVSLMEDTEIFIFDEWAADQDPHFKDYFYNTLLQELKANEKTVIVISHDDRYFNCADKVITLEYGKIREGAD